MQEESWTLVTPSKRSTPRKNAQSSSPTSTDIKLSDGENQYISQSGSKSNSETRNNTAVTPTALKTYSKERPSGPKTPQLDIRSHIEKLNFNDCPSLIESDNASAFEQFFEDFLIYLEKKLIWVPAASPCSINDISKMTKFPCQFADNSLCSKLETKLEVSNLMPRFRSLIKTAIERNPNNLHFYFYFLVERIITQQQRLSVLLAPLLVLREFIVLCPSTALESLQKIIDNYPRFEVMQSVSHTIVWICANLSKEKPCEVISACCKYFYPCLNDPFASGTLRCLLLGLLSNTINEAGYKVSALPEAHRLLSLIAQLINSPDDSVIKHSKKYNELKVLVKEIHESLTEFMLEKPKEIPTPNTKNSSVNHYKSGIKITVNDKKNNGDSSKTGTLLWITFVMLIFALICYASLDKDVLYKLNRYCTASLSQSRQYLNAMIDWIKKNGIDQKLLDYYEYFVLFCKQQFFILSEFYEEYFTLKNFAIFIENIKRIFLHFKHEIENKIFY